MIEEGENECLNGDTLFVFRSVGSGIGFEFGDESGVSDFGFGRAVGSEVNGFTVAIDGGVDFFLDFYFAVFWRLVFDFRHVDFGVGLNLVAVVNP
jgi:hypothetical protein